MFKDQLQMIAYENPLRKELDKSRDSLKLWSFKVYLTLRSICIIYFKYINNDINLKVIYIKSMEDNDV